MATDCSGLAIPEIAMRMIAEQHKSEVETVFACDVLPGSQEWLKSLGIGPILRDMNVRIWKFRPDHHIVAKDLDDKVNKFGKRDAIDLYLCGFVCTPFTPMNMLRLFGVP